MKQERHGDKIARKEGNDMVMAYRRQKGEPLVKGDRGDSCMAWGCSGGVSLFCVLRTKVRDDTVKDLERGGKKRER